MSRLRRTDATAVISPPPEHPGAAADEQTRLRDETDPDPLVEEAADRLRAAVASLDARDEWGRALAWRQVARIALGPLLTELRDSQTAARLLAATRPHDPEPPSRDVVLDVIRAMLLDVHMPSRDDVVPVPDRDDMPFWPA